MARTIREYRQAGTARLLRAQKTAQATIDSFPDPVVVVNPLGSVEQANPAAGRTPGRGPADEPAVPWYPPPPLKSLLDRRTRRPWRLPPDRTGAGPLPRRRRARSDTSCLASWPSGRRQGDLIGAAVDLFDVTKFHLLDRLKSDMVSTVSHELKTPLTSVQMAVHLLLEEVVGPLTPKQVELLLAARQDADRSWP